jgi:hypothetical protein
MLYESHITVDGMSPEEFSCLCIANKLKPVFIVNDTGSNQDQMMTAKFHRVQSREAAISQMDDIASLFSVVVRRKLELVIGRQSPPIDYLYLEFHSKYLIHQHDTDCFLDIILSAGAHTSTNAFKLSAEKDLFYRFMTTRDPVKHAMVLRELKQFKLVNTIAECVVYDDNPNLDSNWSCFDCPLKRKINYDYVFSRVE